MLIAHLHDLEIPVCCGFPVGSDSCLPLIEGAPCSLDVTADHTSLTFNIDGTSQPYEIIETTPQITKVHYSILR
jgi:muramoyltetrapeptide carboxypeptidase